MGLFNQGLSRARDLVHDDITKGALGTDGSAFDASDTSLQAEVSATVLSVTKDKGTRSFQTTYRLDSNTGTGNTYREYANKNASDLVYDRSNFPGVAHTSNDEIFIIKTYTFRQA
jgi:hypothetical protein